MSLERLTKERFVRRIFGEIMNMEESLAQEIDPVLARIIFANSVGLIGIEASRFESPKARIDKSFELEVVKRLDHISFIFEDLLNTNKEIVKKFEVFEKNILEQTNSNYEEDMIEIQDLDDDVIENVIFNYLKEKKKKEVYPSDIAIAFNLDAKKVFEICQRLKKEGKLV